MLGGGAAATGGDAEPPTLQPGPATITAGAFCARRTQGRSGLVVSPGDFNRKREEARMQPLEQDDKSRGSRSSQGE
jgi:hypothetical protein